MAESTPKRKIKDSVFTDLFQNKKYLLQLYKALHPEDIEDNATQKMAKSTAIKMIEMRKMSLEEIAECVPTLSMEELKKLEAEVLQLA